MCSEIDLAGGGCTRILAHDVTGSFFTNKTEAALSSQVDPAAAKYSILSQMGA